VVFYSFFVVYTVTSQIHDCPVRMVILFLAVVMLGISSWDTQIVDTRVFCFKSPISLKLLQVWWLSVYRLGHKVKKKF